MGEENPGPKKQAPCDLLPRTQEYFFITVACHASAPNMAKASLEVTSFSHFSALNARRLDAEILHASTLPRLFKAARLTSLRSTNNYRNSSNNYQHREIIPRGGDRGRDPAGGHDPSAPPPPPTRSERKFTAVRQIWKTKQSNASDQQMRRREHPQPQRETTRILGTKTNRCRIQSAAHADP
ncbi:hypothetical protein SEVIR_5G030600v4 [Setaria viridis]|uniref:Uncharacterized protein n=2 Tax=Setaria TaxID=4554 RepID=A0A368R2L4_SETIT|nr:hypothetical protein SETIT_5G031900v2 [Setaria italica]TKW12349.1 hypothetical protein SEVIR_5G030600v2 [Setaria viridis]